MFSAIKKESRHCEPGGRGNPLSMLLTELKPLKIKIASWQEDEADFLAATDWLQLEGLFFVVFCVSKFNYLSCAVSVLCKELYIYCVVLCVRLAADGD